VSLKGKSMEKSTVDALREQASDFGHVLGFLSSGLTPLMGAALTDNARLLEGLLALDAGGPIDAVSTKYGSALAVAARTRSTECVGLLVEAGAKVGEKEFTAAIESASLEVVSIMINGYMDHVGGPAGANKALVAAAVKVGHPEVFALLMDRFEVSEKLLQTKFGSESSAAAVAIELGRPTIMRSMLDHGLDPQSVVAYGSYEPMPLMHAACVEASLETVEILMERGADVNQVYAGNAPIHFAVDSSRDMGDAKRAARYALVNMLIDKGADLAVKNASGRTVLQLAPAKDERMRSLVRSGRTRDCIASAMNSDIPSSSGNGMRIMPL
jgi:hypothetical protein